MPNQWTNWIPRLTIPALLPKRITRAGIGDIVAAREMGISDLTRDVAPSIYGTYYATNTWVYAAVKLRADSVAAARMVVYQRKPDGSMDPVPHDHVLQQTLDFVNPWWTHSDLWRATETYLSLWGSAYWFIDQDRQGIHIWPLRPDRVHPIPGRNRQTDASTMIVGYEFERSGHKVALTPDEVVWFRYFNPLSEFDGLSPVAPTRLSIDMGHEAVLFNRQFFKQGVSPGNLAFLWKGAVTDEQYDEFMERLENRFKSAEKAHRPILLYNEADVKTLGLSQRDMEFMASLNFTVEEAARAWNVDPEMLMSQKASTYNNKTEAVRNFWAGTVSSEWAFLAAEVNELFLPALGRLVGIDTSDYVCAFDDTSVPAIQRIMAETDDLDLKKITQGVMTVNEYRSGHGLEPVAWGDAWWAPINLYPVEDTTPPPPSGNGEEAVTRAAALRKPGDKPTITEAFVRQLGWRERQFAVIQRDLFDQQERAVRQKVRTLPVARGVVKQAAADVIFNTVEWTEPFKRAGEPVMRGAFLTAARQAASQFRLPPFNADDPAVSRWLTERIRFWADRVNAETGRLLSQELTAAAEGGESIRQIEGRVQKVFDYARGFRTERIARTEMLATSNKGALEEYKQSTVVDEIEWLTTVDDRTRPEHLEANGQRILLGGQFFVGGEQMEAPGLGSDPANNIQCRCTTIPIVRERQ